MEEVWKQIQGYEGKYDISNMGRVRSYAQSKDGRIIKGNPDGKGYLYVKLYYTPQKYRMQKIHRLVGNHFLPNPNGYPQINHKDEDKRNNCVDNLEWCNNEYNHSYGTRDVRAGASNRCCPTTSKEVYSIDDSGNKTVYKSIGEAERLTGICHSNIIAAIKKECSTRKRAGGYRWFYSNN
ncbi:MAG: HNH endonuclease [Bacteroidales bacterium]|nr:HNH endonuclease [Bacteroidales bacterium]